MSEANDQPPKASPIEVADFSPLDFKALWAGRETANRVERGLVRELLPIVRGGRVLELATGEGRLTDLLQVPAMDYVGLDLEGRFLSHVEKQHGTDVRRRYVLANALHLPFQSSTFSAVVMFRVFNFLPDPKICLEEACRVLAPGGTLVVSHNPKPSWATLMDDVRTALHDPLALAQGTLTFGRSGSAPVLRSNFPTFALTRKRFTALAEEAGFHVETERPCGFEDYRPFHRLPPPLFLALSSALSRLGGFPTRVVALSKPGGPSLPPPRTEGILACPNCRAPLPPGAWCSPVPCAACGFLPGWEEGLLDLRWPRPLRARSRSPPALPDRMTFHAQGPGADGAYPRDLQAGGPQGPGTTMYPSPIRAHRDTVGDRVAVLLKIAASRGDALTIDEALDLLPEGGPTSREDLLQWSTDHPDQVRVVGNTLISPCAEPNLPGKQERGQRAAYFLRCATELLTGPLAPVRSLALVVAVTGSTAFHSAEAQDDLDLLIILRRGSLAFFLVWSYAALRWRLLRSPRGSLRPPVCMNLVLEEPQAHREFNARSGLLIAREALSAVVIQGQEPYRALLSEAAWMREFLPRLYHRVVDTGGHPPAIPGTSAPLPVRLVSSLLFLPLGAYLQMVSLWRNHRIRRRERGAGSFRTTIEPGRLKFTSVAFDRLKQAYETSTGDGP